MKPYSILFLVMFFMVSCTKMGPQNARDISDIAQTYPSFSDAVIPCNIAPLNFKIKVEGDDFFVESYSRKGGRLQSEGETVQWNLKKWHKLLSENKGDTLFTEVYVKRGGQWYKYPTIKSFIAPEEIDNYISYRLIEPSYTVYEYLTINQRNLENFDERVIYSNSLLSENEDGHCINCHSYQDYNRTGNMQFHVRQFKGGTVIVSPNGVKKVDLKTDNSISSGVYPAWHPTKKLIAYSVNNISQHFPKKGSEKVEVQDSRSGLILYDVDKNKVHIIVDDPNELETFPSWSPDGRYLYYVSAKYPEGVGPDDDLMQCYKDFHYNIYRMAFDSQTLEFSKPEMVFDASAIGKSATFPRVSPDGQYLLFTLADYGNFHIWHKSSDLCLLALKRNEFRLLTEVNSPDVESYHSWSSNGHWIIFSSRRDDGSYTRPYISYFTNGKAGKPFILPRKDPDFYAGLFKSYNIPEFMVEPVMVSRKQLMKAIDKEPEKATCHDTHNRKTVSVDTVENTSAAYH